MQLKTFIAEVLVTLGEIKGESTYPMDVEFTLYNLPKYYSKEGWIIEVVQEDQSACKLNFTVTIR